MLCVCRLIRRPLQSCMGTFQLPTAVQTARRAAPLRPLDCLCTFSWSGEGPCYVSDACGDMRNLVRALRSVPCRQCSSEGNSAAPEPTLTSRRAVLVVAACASSAAGVGALLLGTRMLWNHGWHSRSHVFSAGACQAPGAAARLELYGDLGGFHHQILTDSAQAQSLFDLVRGCARIFKQCQEGSNA